MSDIDEKLILKLGQRIGEQNEILRMIAASLEGIESHLRQMAISSNPAPNYQRPLSEYPTFDWSSDHPSIFHCHNAAMVALGNRRPNWRAAITI
jgi:hypothetical protein